MKLKMTLQKIINHIRHHFYMNEIERDKNRTFQSQEVFTPTDKVINLLEEYSTELKDHTKDFLDPSCGDGQFLGEVLIHKVQNGITFETALNSIYGVDLMQDNIDLCQNRLLCGREDLRHIVEKNIICADALRYHYRFDGTDPYRSDQDIHNENFFEIT
tara:strand:- start:348 stop:824 length:477 start_codon:yes stop_codon:yes gene_type:complete